MFVFDCEVFKYNWLFVFKRVSTGEYTIILDDKDKLRKFCEENNKALFIGFNNITYDNIILSSILSNVDPAETNRLIIEGKQRWLIQKALGIKEYNFKSMDLMQDILGMSLKEAEGYMCMSIEESDVDFEIDRPLTKEEIEKTIFYCKHDVDATEKLLEIRSPYIKSKMLLVKMFNLNSNNLMFTNARLCSTILNANRKTYDDEMIYDLPKELILTKPEYREILKLYTNGPLDYTKKIKVNIAGVEHIFAYGGLHGALENFEYRGEMWQIDATSYYPTLMIQYDYMSRNLKDSSKFEEIYKTRIAAKKVDKAKANALKLIINTTYGAMKSEYNDLYDAKMANQVCITGQLFLTDLIEKIEPYCKLVQSNTDGILIIPYDKDKILEEVHKVEERIRVKFEIDKCSGVWQKDVNNYIMSFEDGHVKTKGAYVSQFGGARQQTNGYKNSGRILDEAVVNYFVNGIHPIDTIMNCNDKYMFQLITKTGGSYTNTYWKSSTGDIKVNKVNRVYASKDSNQGNLYKTKTVEKNEIKTIRKDSIANIPEHCIVDNADKINIEDIDKNWYIQVALKRIADFKGGN